MKPKEVKTRLDGVADAVGRRKDGTWVARLEFFYRFGKTAEDFAKKVAAALPEAVIIGCGEVWKPFRGGASVANSSHFWVEFNFKEAAQ